MVQKKMYFAILHTVWNIFIALPAVLIDNNDSEFNNETAQAEEFQLFLSIR